jgi:nicotinamide-nucleotide amidase
MMDVEILTIGDELLLGQTVDTNSAYIAQKLSEIGLLPRYKSTCGDLVEEIESAVKLAVKRAGLVIATGGLGPTDDDNTKKAIVRIFQRRLVLNEKLLDDIRARYKKRGIEMPAINENQALIPAGAHIFRNRLGSAVGIGIIENNFVFIALPGVPTEMRIMMAEEILPFLSGKNLQKPVAMVTFKTHGLFESQMAEIIAPELNLEPGVKLAYLPGFSGVDLRVLAFGPDSEAAFEKVEKVADYIEKKVGQFIYGKDKDTLPSVIGELLKKNKSTLATAESCTGGELGELITTVAGSSEYYLGGVVSYANQVKITQLGVNPDTIEKHGAVSEQCALEMAVGCKTALNSNYALSITGIAGPDGGTKEKPVGTTFIGLSSEKSTFAKHFNFGIDRETVRGRACYAALELLRREILKIK